MSIQILATSDEGPPSDHAVQARLAEGAAGGDQLRFVAHGVEVLASLRTEPTWYLLLSLRLPDRAGDVPPPASQALVVAAPGELPAIGAAAYGQAAGSPCQALVLNKLAEALRQATQRWATAPTDAPGPAPKLPTRELPPLPPLAEELLRTGTLPLAASHSLWAVAGHVQQLLGLLGQVLELAARALPPAAPAESGKLPAALPAGNSLHERWLRSFYALLDAHLDKSDLSVEWLAMQLHMSRKTLLRKLQRLLNLSPRDVIQQYRLRRGAELLRAGYPVAEAAYAVGFNTPAYFGQCFKELYHVTPRQFAGGS